MHILLLSDKFHPEVAAPSIRGLEHAAAWVRAGHQVTVVTGAPNHPRGRVFPGYRNAPWVEEWIEGVRVLRVWSFVAPNTGRVRRSLDYLSLAGSGTAWFWRYAPFDVILATSPPLVTAMQGWALARLRDRPWVFEVRDLWPASIPAVGVGMGNRTLAALERVELGLYARADSLVVVTEAFREDLVRRGVPGDKIHLVRNGVDCDRFAPRPRPSRASLGIAEDAFVVGYVGTMGMAHGLSNVLEAARRTPEITWLLMGDGAEAADITAKAANLPNVVVKPPIPHAEVPTVTASLDVSLVHLRPSTVFETVIPSKIFESMAMGIPMLAAIQGEGAQLIERARAGRIVPPGDPDALAAGARALRDNKRAYRAMAKAGPREARAHYDRSRTAAALLEVLEATARKGLR